MAHPDRCHDCGEYRPGVAQNCWNCTPAYDSRYDRAQTIDGAKARYVEDGNDYSIEDFERDVERILEEGNHPDRGRPWLGRVGRNRSTDDDGPLLGGQVVTS